ncbi:MAG: hypothetical protein M1837_004678 [Sclerophora amabilis]|nr:MAG: hypothetical protein M1837_004678 [Sclerophora amabilis]
MLLLHQTGSVKIGEVTSHRYTVTYTPSADRILPTPSALHVKIKNTSAIPLRAAYLHGPYTLYVATYPSTFDPNRKSESVESDGAPEYEPNLKAGGTWSAILQVPEDIREDASTFSRPSTHDRGAKTVTWVIEITSQVIFSQSAAVHYELLVGRDEQSLSIGFSSAPNGARTEPGKVEDHQLGRGKKEGRHPAQPKGVHSKAVKLVVEDTARLWNKPAFPQWDDDKKRRMDNEYPDPGEEDIATIISGDRRSDQGDSKQPKKQKQVHLVVLTHGLHSNLGADMLYLKESIDGAVREARKDARIARARRKRPPSKDGGFSPSDDVHTSPKATDQTSDDLDEGDSDEEDVVVRGFSGNAVRTEKGIKYLGKRLARYVLATTYPDQPFLPVSKSATKSFSRTLTGQSSKAPQQGGKAHKNSTVEREPKETKDLPYKVTSISFIGHSLGGLVQTYAIAYIQKHSPHFFHEIKPINFIALATPFLGLSNENPLYVKFALDFGLVGRTGQDLGLTWRAPNIARSGWGAVVGGLGNGKQKLTHEKDPGSKPLLRILPSGPAHKVLQMFRNRTVYSNVINDGIVPLRTSCLLFLDWRGLDRVKKARKESGLVGTVAGWGWAELTGVNANTQQIRSRSNDGRISSENTPEGTNTPTQAPAGGTLVPQPSDVDASEAGISETLDDPTANQFLRVQKANDEAEESTKQSKEPEPSHDAHPFSAFMTLFRPQHPKGHPFSPKSSKVYSRSQTLPLKGSETDVATSQGSEIASASSPEVPPSVRPQATRGDSTADDPNNLLTPPKTTIFESAGAILNPPLPGTEYLVDPSSRPRTIFHDRVYHPDDIPPPPRKRRTGSRMASFNNESGGTPDNPRTASDAPPPNAGGGNVAGADGEASTMKVEEKIARAYHHDLSWRKVLVSLEPDAHNNMIVRRMFSNAYGWPVIKHLVDTHFADTYEAITSDAKEPGSERAKGLDEEVGKDGEEVHRRGHQRTKSEKIEAVDEVGDLSLTAMAKSASSSGRPSLGRQDSAQWSDAYFYDTDEEEDEDEHEKKSKKGGEISFQSFLSPKSTSPSSKQQSTTSSDPSTQRESTASNPSVQRESDEAEIADFLANASPEVRETISLPPRPSSVDGVGEPTTPKATAPPPADPATETPTTTGSTHLGLPRSLEQPFATPARKGSTEDQHGRRGIARMIAGMGSAPSSPPREEQQQ